MGFLFSVFFVKILLFFLLSEISLKINISNTFADQNRIHEAPGQTCPSVRRVAHNARTCMCRGEGTPNPVDMAYTRNYVQFAYQNLFF
jgi:hypothetical protein